MLCLWFFQNCEFISILTSKHTEFISCNSDFFFSELQDINTNAFFHPSSCSSCLSESLIFDYFYFHSFGSLTVAQTCTAKQLFVETMRFGGRRNLKNETRHGYICDTRSTRHARICVSIRTCYVWLCASVKETAGILVIQGNLFRFKQEFSCCYNEVYFWQVKRVFVMFLLRLWLSYLEEIKSSSVHIVLSLDVSVALQLPSLSWDITK